MPLLKPLALQVDSLSDAQASVSIRSFGDELKFVSNSFHEYKITDTGLQQNGASNLKFNEVSESDFDAHELLGQGSSASVYRATKKRTGQTVAIKRINCLEKDRRRQIMNDIRGVCNVSHPSLVQFLGAYKVSDSSQISIVLEYMDGGSLADFIKKGRKVPEDVLAEVARQVLQGLSFLHRRHTLHRDIKPANILLNLKGQVKIADFGISAFVDNTLAVCNTFLGTVTYMSPERINNRPYSFSADIWSIGLTFLECALGKYPYDATGGPLGLMMQVLNDEPPIPSTGLSTEFRDFLQQCLMKDPYKRPAAHDLLSHPFLLTRADQGLKNLERYLSQSQSETAAKVNLGGLSKEEERRDIELAKSKNAERTSSTDGIALQCTREISHRVFSLLSQAVIDSNSLTMMFSPHIVLECEKIQCQGQEQVLKQLQAVCQSYCSPGANSFVVDAVDVQILQDGSVCAHVNGVIEIKDVGPLAAAFLQNQPPSVFEAMLEIENTLPSAQENPLITSFVFRRL